MDITTSRSVLAPEITGLHMQTDQFKTKRISLTFLLPLTLHGTAAASLLARLLTRSTKKYDTPVALHRKLLSLYGARFSAQVIKLADYQLLNASITVIEDGFSLHHEALAKEAAALLCDAVFEPNINENSFHTDDVEVCRRLLMESIESTVNDKRKYAIAQMYSAMCQNEPFGIEIGGNIETARQITGQDTLAYWREMLQQAPVVVTVIGNGSPTEIYNEILSRFQTVNRSPLPLHPAFQFHKPQEVQTVSETMQLTQGKLVMGFRSNISTLQENNLALRIMCDIFGGAPYSKLFTVVREKMSLCYYCAARLQSQKGFICVDSGVENQNIEAAKAGILEQLSAMQKGEFDQPVIEASKMSMADGARSVTDSQEAIESWYLARLLDEQLYSPEEFIAQLADITKEDIVKAAQSVSLDTVYTLRAKEGA